MNGGIGLVRFVGRLRLRPLRPLRPLSLLPRFFHDLKVHKFHAATRHDVYVILIPRIPSQSPAPISSDYGALDDEAYWAERIERLGEKAWKEYSQLKLLSEEGDKLPRLLIWRVGGAGHNLGCHYLITSIPLLSIDMEKPKKLAPGQDDHGFDAGTYVLKAYLMPDEEALQEAYMTQLGGKIPDSGFQSQLAMKAAEEKIEDQGQNDPRLVQGDVPFRLENERWVENSDDDFPI